MRNAEKRLAISLVVAMALAAAARPGHGQFWDRLTNPKVTVTLTHPPSLGLNVARVAFGPSKGECSDELVAAIIEDFVNNNVDVLTRENLDDILAEHKFTLTGQVDKNTAVQLGQILGPAALVFLKILRCASDEDTLRRPVRDLAGNERTQFISRTRVFYKASIQTVDLATGRIFAARTIDADQSEEYTSTSCCPEHPSAYDLTDRAVRAVSLEIHRMFFPWTEVRQLHFFDDKDCGLKAAFQLLQAGDLQGTLHHARENLALCQQRPDIKPKLLVHALYNVGMANFLVGDYDQALEYFQQAATHGGGNIVGETMAECRRAKQLAAEMQRVEERAVLEAEAPMVAASAPSQGGGSAEPGGDPQKESVEERLRKLDALFKKGLITKVEYEKKRAEILKDL